MTRARFRGLLLGMIVVLYALSIPWYRETGQEPALVLGLPDWVAVALGCYALVALLNAAAWLLTDIHDEVEGPDGEGP